MEPTIHIPENSAYFQLDIILYSASRASQFDISEAIYRFQSLKNLATISSKKRNDNQLVYTIKKKERNMDYSGLYSVMIFVECRAIKNISLKAVPYKGNTVELLVQYFCLPKIFLAHHGKRKFTEPLSKTTSFNVYASPQKKAKCSIGGSIVGNNGISIIRGDCNVLNNLDGIHSLTRSRT
jgi:hypothetical protein